MDTKIKILILSLFTAFNLFGQSPLSLAVRYNITSATGGDPYTVTGVVSDDLSRFTGSDVQVGDSLYVIDGSDLYVLKITAINSVVGPTVNLTADDPSNAGISLPTGQSAIVRPTPNYKLPIYISGLRDDLRSMMMNRQAKIIDQITGGGVASITDFISAGQGVPPSAAASGETGETWRNMSTGELWRSDGGRWHPFVYDGKECQDTVLVSAVTIQSGGSLITGSPLVRNSSGVWQHMYNHPSGNNLIPDGVVTDIITGPRAIIQYCGVRKGSGATPNTSYYVDQTVSTGFTTTKPTTNIRPLGKVAANGDFLINSGLLFSRDNLLNSRDSTFVKTDGSYSNKRVTSDIERNGETNFKSTSTKRANVNIYIDPRVASEAIKQTFVQGGNSNVYNFPVDAFFFDKYSGNVGIDTGISFRTYFGRSDQNTISSGGTDTTKNRTWSWQWNQTPIGTRNNLAYGGYGQNYEFNFISGPPPNGQRLMEMNGTVTFSNGDNFRHLNWQANHNANCDATNTFPRASEGRLLDEYYLTNTRGQQKWRFNMIRQINTLTAFDSAQIVFTNAGNNYFPITQGGVGLIRNDSAGYLDLGGSRMSISLSTAVPEFVAKGSPGFGFGNAAYPATSGITTYLGTGTEGLKLFRSGQSDTWNLSKDANGFFLQNAALIPVQIHKTAPNNSFTVASDGNIGFGTGSAPYKVYVVNATGNTGGALIGASGGTMTSGGAAVYYSNIGTTGTNWLYVLKGEMSVPSNALGAQVYNTSNTASADARVEIVTTHVNASPYLDFQGGGGTTARYTQGVANNQTNNPYRITNDAGNLTSNIMWELDPVLGRHRWGNKSSTYTDFFPGRTATPEGNVTADPGSLSGSNISGAGSLWIKKTGTSNTGWEQAVTTSGTSTSISTMMREESFTSTSGQTAFTIAYSAPAVSGTSVPIRVYRNGVRLFYVASGPTITQFTYSGTTVTTAANTVGDIITVEYLN